MAALRAPERPGWLDLALLGRSGAILGLAWRLAKLSELIQLFATARIYPTAPAKLPELAQLHRPNCPNLPNCTGQTARTCASALAKLPDLAQLDPRTTWAPRNALAGSMWLVLGSNGFMECFARLVLPTSNAHACPISLFFVGASARAFANEGFLAIVGTQAFAQTR